MDQKTTKALIWIAALNFGFWILSLLGAGFLYRKLDRATNSITKTGMFTAKAYWSQVELTRTMITGIPAWTSAYLLGGLFLLREVEKGKKRLKMPVKEEFTTKSTESATVV